MERMGNRRRAGLGLALGFLLLLALVVMLAGCAAGDTNFTNVVASGNVTAGGTVSGAALSVSGDSNLGPVYGKAPVSAKTAAYTVVAADTGTLFANVGATGAVTFTLPVAAAGLRYCFATVAAQQVAVDPSGTNQILALTNAGGDKITNSTAGNSVCLVAVSATQWVAAAPYGTWADGN